MSRLEDISSKYREKELAKNRYDYNDQYQKGHPDALSDGDELGKGLDNGSIGGATDIKQRETLKTKNTFTFNKPYDSSTA